MSQRFAEYIRQYKAEKDLVKRVELIWDSGEIYFDSHSEELHPIMDAEIENCQKENYLDGEVVLRVLRIQTFSAGISPVNMAKEVEFIDKNIDKLKDNQIKGFAYMFMGISSAYQGNYAKSLDLAWLAKKCYEGNEDSRHYGWVEYNFAALYLDLKDFDNALKYFQTGCEHFKRCSFDYGYARCETGIATIKVFKNEIDEAEKLYLNSLKVYKELEMDSAVSRIYNDLGVIFRKRKDYEKSTEYLKNSLELRKKIQHHQGIATSLNELGETLFESDQLKNAIEYLKQSVELCTQINNKFKLFRAHHLLYLSYKKLNNLGEALFHLEEYDKFKDVISNTSTNNKIKELEKKAAAEQAEKITAIERKKNQELKFAFDTIEEKNKEILDSINYAKRIQYTLLANDEVLKKHLPEHFILFQPKDIVSGDFYWFSHGINDSTFYLAVCDSTGHGVPGAFMSLLNITYLNEAINEKHISDPGKILDYVREKLIKNISQDGAKDGMDATLVKFEWKSDRFYITYAAAHNYPFLIRNAEFIDLPFDKMPVGKDDVMKPFSTHVIPAEMNDMIYFGTDGYADQFGGEKFGVKKAGGKKMKKSNLKKLLIENSKLPVENQKTILIKAFADWKGDLEQVDDVCIIGIRI